MEETLEGGQGPPRVVVPLGMRWNITLAKIVSNSTCYVDNYTFCEETKGISFI